MVSSRLGPRVMSQPVSWMLLWWRVQTGGRRTPFGWFIKMIAGNPMMPLVTIALVVGFVDGKLEGYIAFGLLFVAALFTAFYMGRQLFMVFFGEPRTEAAKYTGERAYGMPVMTNVLIALGIGATVIGFMNIPSGFWILDWIFPEHAFTSWLEHAVPYAHAGSAQMVLAILAVGGGLAMIWLARSIYLNKPLTDDNRDPLEVEDQTGGLFALANARLFWDETYDRFLEQPFNRAARWLAEKLDWQFWHDFLHETVIRDSFNGVTRLLTKPVDLGLIDGAVNGVGRLVQWVAGYFRRLQTGYVRVYALSVLFGALLVMVLLLAPLLRQMLGL